MPLGQNKNIMEKRTAFILFPNQLFKDLSLLNQVDEIYLVEEFLFFKQYKFHKQKLVLHRASMKHYEQLSLKNNFKVHYVEAGDAKSDIRVLIDSLADGNISGIHYYDVCDDWLEQRINTSCTKHHIESIEYPTPLFTNTKDELKPYFETRHKYFHNDFYILQRKKLKVLIDGQEKPLGGKWSFDADNRRKYPKDKTPPEVIFPEKGSIYQEAIEYVEQYFGANYGRISNEIIYPISHEQGEEWLNHFLATRFFDFGEYEDAIVDNQIILNHSLLSPLLNIGLLLPMQVVNAAIDYANNYNVPINSLEGFVRQIIGWREFIRGVYVYKGRQERTSNYWKFTNSIPDSCYNATTGIAPLDSTINKLLDTAYCHHIERLMVLGNFMALSETDPKQVYKWFMELFIDAYDWVMVPNVYGMSQFADGGLMATKPYISGSNYILKMSDFKKGEWCDYWDALFWTFMNRHRDFFLSNPRLGMLIKTYDKMSVEKKRGYEMKRREYLGDGGIK